MFKTLEFHNDQLVVTRDQAGEPWVAVRPICDALGISFSSQLKRLVTSRQFRCTDIEDVGPNGRLYRMVCIHLDHLDTWLRSIGNKVRRSLRDKLREYQRE